MVRAADGAGQIAEHVPHAWQRLRSQRPKQVPDHMITLCEKLSRPRTVNKGVEQWLCCEHWALLLYWRSPYSCK